MKLIKKLLSNNSLIYLAATIIPNALGFITLPIYSSVLTPTDYGIVSYTNSFTGVLTVLSSLCLNVYFLRFYNSRENKDKFTGTMFGNLLAWNFLLFLGSCLVFPFIFYFLKSDVPFFPYMFLTLFNSFLINVEIIPLRLFRIRGEAISYFKRMIGKSLMSIALMLILLFVFKIGVMAKFYSMVIPSAVYSAYFVGYIIKHCGIKFSWSEMKAGLKFSYPFIPSELFSKFSSIFLNISIMKLVSVSYLGIFSIASTMSQVVGVVHTSVIMAYEPVLYLAAEKKDFSKTLSETKNKCYMLLLVVALAGGMLVREAVTLLLPESYWNAWSVVQIIVLEFPIEVITSMYYNINIIESKRFSPIISKIISLIMQIISCYALYYIIGDSAFGWSIVIKSLTGCLVLILCSKEKFGYGMKLHKDLLAFVLVFITMILSNTLNSLNLFVTIGLKLIIICVLMLFFTKLYKVNLKEIISSVLPTRRLKNEQN